MKIAVLGYSGAGKSTLARALGEKYGIPVLHFDTVQFTPNWEVRDRGEAHQMVHEFMENPQWVIDGTYSRFEYERRLLEADEKRWTLSSSGGCCGRAAPGKSGRNFKRLWRNILTKQSF